VRGLRRASGYGCCASRLVSPLALGLVKRPVGGLDQALGVRRTIEHRRGRADADRYHAGRTGGVFDTQAPDRRAEALGDNLRTVVVDASQQCDEFLPP